MLKHRNALAVAFALAMSVGLVAQSAKHPITLDDIQRLAEVRDPQCSPDGRQVAYVVAYGPAADPLRHRVMVTQPSVTLPPIAAGTVVSVKAVNARGLEGWDWAKTIVGDPHAARITQ